MLVVLMVLVALVALAALAVLAVLAELAPALLGTRALPRPAMAAMDAVALGQPYAKAAVDIAVHDLAARSLGVPVSDLLGGALRDRVPSYYAVGIGSPEETARTAREKLAEGYPRIQLKIGGRDVAEDIAVIRKVAETIGTGARLVADGNRGLSGVQAVTLSRACADIPMVLEQPCATLEEIAMIRGQVCHPLFLDEATLDVDTVATVMGRGLADGFGMKITRVGGLQAMATIRDLCAARNMPMTCEDSWGGDITAAACVHMGATLRPGLLEGVWLAAPYIAQGYSAEGQVMVEAGHVTVPKGPGLGIVIDPARVGAPVRSFGG